MQKEKKVIFLYTRLPDYFYQCVQHFTETYSCSAVIVMHPADTNTKYHFKDTDKIKLVYKNDIPDLVDFVKQQEPAAIYVSGWVDKAYKSIAKLYRPHIPVILGLDNPWVNSLKQRMLCKLSSWLLHPYFNKVWVAGVHQYAYALKLGYSSNNIMQGVYAADATKFDTEQYATDFFQKRDSYPKVLLYVGRMVDYKQPELLAKAFHELQQQDEQCRQWKLVMIGEGPKKEAIAFKKYENVFISSFISPENLSKQYLEAGIFCLPSVEEHWGVVVQEAALAGLPLLLSDTIYAGYSFLIPAHNGLRFKTKDKESLKQSLLNLMKMDAGLLWQMGHRSRSLARRIDHTTWSAELNAILY